MVVWNVCWQAETCTWMLSVDVVMCLPPTCWRMVAGLSTAKEQLQRELDAVRRKQSALESNGDAAAATVGAPPAGTSAPPAQAAAVAPHAAPVTAVDSPTAAAAAAVDMSAVAAAKFGGPGAAPENGIANGATAFPMEEDEETDVD